MEVIGKDSDAGRDWGQEEKGKTEDEVAGWHHWLDGRESEWTGVGDGQGVLACCNSWGHKESDTTERLNWIRPYNTKKRCPFHHKGLECKSRKSRDTWNSRQVWPWSTKWSRAKANRVLPRERTGHSKHSLPTTQEKILYIDITRWSIPKSHWLYSLQSKMEKLYTVSKNKTRSWLWLRSWTSFCQIQT